MEHGHEPVEMSRSGLKNEVSRIALDLSPKLCLSGCPIKRCCCGCFPLVSIISHGNLGVARQWAARVQWNFVLNSAPSGSNLTEFALEECFAKFLWSKSRKQ